MSAEAALAFEVETVEIRWGEHKETYPLSISASGSLLKHLQEYLKGKGIREYQTWDAFKTVAHKKRMILDERKLHSPGHSDRDPLRQLLRGLLGVVGGLGLALAAPAQLADAADPAAVPLEEVVGAQRRGQWRYELRLLLLPRALYARPAAAMAPAGDPLLHISAGSVLADVQRTLNCAVLPSDCSQRVLLSWLVPALERSGYELVVPKQLAQYAKTCSEQETDFDTQFQQLKGMDVHAPLVFVQRASFTAEQRSVLDVAVQSMHAVREELAAQMKAQAKEFHAELRAQAEEVARYAKEQRSLRKELQEARKAQQSSHEAVEACRAEFEARLRAQEESARRAAEALRDELLEALRQQREDAREGQRDCLENMEAVRSQACAEFEAKICALEESCREATGPPRVEFMEALREERGDAHERQHAGLEADGFLAKVQTQHTNEQCSPLGEILERCATRWSSLEALEATPHVQSPGAAQAQERPIQVYEADCGTADTAKHVCIECSSVGISDITLQDLGNGVRVDIAVPDQSRADLGKRSASSEPSIA